MIEKTISLAFPNQWKDEDINQAKLWFVDGSDDTGKLIDRWLMDYRKASTKAWQEFVPWFAQCIQNSYTDSQEGIQKANQFIGLAGANLRCLAEDLFKDETTKDEGVLRKVVLFHYEPGTLDALNKINPDALEAWQSRIWTVNRKAKEILREEWSLGLNACEFFERTIKDDRKKAKLVFEVLSDLFVSDGYNRQNSELKKKIADNFCEQSSYRLLKTILSEKKLSEQDKSLPLSERSSVVGQATLEYKHFDYLWIKAESYLPIAKELKEISESLPEDYFNQKVDYSNSSKNSKKRSIPRI